MKVLLRGKGATGEVWLNGNRLCLGRSLKVCNHSPTGFAWGYGGSGPAQLALAVLLEVTNDEQVALSHYHTFKWDVIARLPFAQNFQIEVDLSPYLQVAR